MNDRARPRSTRDGSEIVYGVHPVSELLSCRVREVERVYVVRGRHAKLGRLLRAAREQGVPVSHVAPEVLAQKAGRRAVHQGVAASIAPLAYASADEVCRQAARDPAGLLVLVDRVTDPRNLGAIIRTAAGAGAGGVLIATEATVGVTAVTVKAAAGTVARLAVAREPKPARRIETLKDQGFSAVVLDPRGDSLWESGLPTGRLVFVAGGEAEGPSAGVLRAADRRVAVPLAGGVESLNVAVALGVLLFEAVRLRRSGPG